MKYSDFYNTLMKPFFVPSYTIHLKWMVVPLILNCGISLADSVAPPSPSAIEQYQLQNEVKGGQPGARPMGRPDLRWMKAGVRNYKQGELFFLENQNQPGIETSKSGLQYKVLKAGTGKSPKLSDSVEVYYIGKLLDGTDFANHDQQNGAPDSITIRNSIPAWQEALTKMKVGSRWELFVPPELGYGNAGSPPTIGPDAALYYELELVSIKSRGTKGQIEKALDHKVFGESSSNGESAKARVP